MYDWKKDLDIVRLAVQGAGAVAMQYFFQSPKVWWKDGGSSPVSEADIAVNSYLESFLRPLRPSYGWLSEETDDDLNRLNCETIFVVDPIDGTRAFISGKKEWCISVAVVHRGRPMVGVVYASALEKEFVVSVGMQSTCNGTEISVASSDARDCLMIMANDSLCKKLESFINFQKIPCILSLCLRLSMVASGEIDIVLVNRNANDWDLAAADLLITGAGGILVDADGEPITYNRSKVSHDFLLASPKYHFTNFKKYLSTL
ncbi:MAG: 3'(2'),5'-bisphosphate nucleotidase CysQ [Candidatus Liberibacter europaeus]|uniref:3'(2'),5'-bisphosphate nucleotidase CysQ n=1 Tax=Candidatus Liberibacter europaeus TaxID=744859 RepID=A0A2T4VXQ3_9HYPH|nr:3'(2'),5'-bisphosphate nucleotidase CysQ [Candidatus Liberibacter europaeus]PTL86553.1 MAG: 3'(2'),5'-bisphosphate nucleotidase CysQ [Candidatus Liberibacter europaeus]